MTLSVIAGPVILPARAATDEAPFKIGNKVSRSFQKCSGITGATDFLAGKALAAAIRHKLHGQVKVKVKTFGFTDLMAGKVKSLEITAHNCEYKGVPVGDIHAVTINPVWLRYVKQHGQRAGLRKPVALKLDGDLSATSVADALASPAVSSSLRSVKLDLPGLGSQRLEFVDPHVAIDTDGIEIKTLLVTAGARPETGVPIKLKGTPELQGNSRVFIRDLQVDSPVIPNQQEFAAFTSKLLNPLIDFSRMDRQTRAFRLESLKVLHNAVHFSGNLLLAPAPVYPPVAQQPRK